MDYFFNIHEIENNTNLILNKKMPISKILHYYYSIYNYKNSCVDWDNFGGYE